MHETSTLAPVTRREGSIAGSISKFYSIDEVAELLGVSPRTLRRAIKRKELITHKLGRAVRIAETDLKAFIAQLRCV